MGKISYMRLKGSQNLRLRLLLSTLSSTPILIEDIRADATWPGLLSHEVSLLRLLEKVSDDCHVEINKTGLPSYGITLVAETTSGCFISADTAVSYAPGKEDGMDVEENKELSPPEDVGEQFTSILLREIEQGGVVDSTHQGLLFLLCALCPRDVSKVRVGQLVPHGIEVLRHIRDFLGVKFVIKPDPSTMTVILKCVGCGLKNLWRKIS